MITNTLEKSDVQDRWSPWIIRGMELGFKGRDLELSVRARKNNMRSPITKPFEYAHINTYAGSINPQREE